MSTCSCIEHCSICDDPNCGDHLFKCSNCDDWVCKGCYDQPTHTCENCTEVEEPADD